MGTNVNIPELNESQSFDIDQIKQMLKDQDRKGEELSLELGDKAEEEIQINLKSIDFMLTLLTLNGFPLNKWIKNDYNFWNNKIWIYFRLIYWIGLHSAIITSLIQLYIYNKDIFNNLIEIVFTTKLLLMNIPAIIILNTYYFFTVRNITNDLVNLKESNDFKDNTLLQKIKEFILYIYTILNPIAMILPLIIAIFNSELLPSILALTIINTINTLVNLSLIIKYLKIVIIQFKVLNSKLNEKNEQAILSNIFELIIESYYRNMKLIKRTKNVYSGMIKTLLLTMTMELNCIIIMFFIRHLLNNLTLWEDVIEIMSIHYFFMAIFPLKALFLLNIYWRTRSIRIALKSFENSVKRKELNYQDDKNPKLLNFDNFKVNSQNLLSFSYFRNSIEVIPVTLLVLTLMMIFIYQYIPCEMKINLNEIVKVRSFVKADAYVEIHIFKC